MELYLCSLFYGVFLSFKFNTESEIIPILPDLVNASEGKKRE